MHLIKNINNHTKTISYFLTNSILFALIILASANTSGAKENINLLELELEELGEITITSVSKKKEPLFGAASAIQVINQKDIRRSGATSIPELLRMVPGIEVARIDGNKWAVTARGFNALFSNKLLVLLDGRSMYTPLFSGVYWDTLDTLLEDIERIEVIRGPGGTLWGSNAVNGVINIITKDAKDSQGKLVTAQVGNQENGEGAVRFGGKIGKNAHYRATAKYFNRGSFQDSQDRTSADGWDATRGEFRIDWEPSKISKVSFQGGAYSGESNQKRSAVLTTSSPFFNQSDEDIDLSGGHIQVRWKKSHDDGSETEFRSYFDQNNRDDRVLGQTINTFDIDFQRRFSSWKNHDIIWGLGQRVIWDKLNETFTFSATPAERFDYITSSFFQDEISFLDKKLRLIIGSKFELNSRTDYEIQPNIRLAWEKNNNHMFWGAISRAVRTPSRVENSQNLVFSGFFNGQNNILTLAGDGRSVSEKLISFEMGYRFKPEKNFSIDVATFYNRYDAIKTSENQTNFSSNIPLPAHVVRPSVFDNNANGEAYGIEIFSKLKPKDFWELNMGFTWFKMHLHLDPTSTDTSTELSEGSSPEYRFHIRSYLDLPKNLEFDSFLYYVDSLSDLNVDSYIRMDFRLGWKPVDPVELSLSLQNIFDPHPEFSNQNGIFASEIPRTIQAKLTYRF